MRDWALVRGGARILLARAWYLRFCFVRCMEGCMPWRTQCEACFACERVCFLCASQRLHLKLLTVPSLPADKLDMVLEH
eukprot:4354468-Pleurochrysis_carterae.AAC.1